MNHTLESQSMTYLVLPSKYHISSSSLKNTVKPNGQHSFFVVGLYEVVLRFFMEDTELLLEQVSASTKTDFLFPFALFV